MTKTPLLNWIKKDEAASPAQREAIETILTGRAGGPWAVLGRFVGRWLDTRYAPIRITEGENTKRLDVTGLVEGAITDIRGRDRAAPAGRP